MADGGAGREDGGDVPGSAAVAFLTQEHQRTLAGLHTQIRSLQAKNAEATLKLAMASGGISVPDEQLAAARRREGELEEAAARKDARIAELELVNSRLRLDLERLTAAGGELLGLCSEAPRAAAGAAPAVEATPPRQRHRPSPPSSAERAASGRRRLRPSPPASMPGHRKGRRPPPRRPVPCRAATAATSTPNAASPQHRLLPKPPSMSPGDLAATSPAALHLNGGRCGSASATREAETLHRVLESSGGGPGSGASQTLVPTRVVPPIRIRRIGRASTGPGSGAAAAADQDGRPPQHAMASSGGGEVH